MRSVRRTSVIPFHKKERSNFQEKMNKKKDFTRKKEMGEARRKKAYIVKLVTFFLGLLTIFDMENSSGTKLN